MTDFQRMEYLVNYLNQCTELYEKGFSYLSDEEWDNLYFELVELEKNYKPLPNSPTQKIHFKEVDTSLRKVKHNHLMLSLEKTKDLEIIKSFVKKQPILIMCKMDGLTCSLTYQNGCLIAAETRGNGEIGEDILHNAFVVPSIPNQIDYKEELVIDGEIICTYEDFKSFQEEYKNPRNFAAGSIRLLDAKECAKRKLTFVAWDSIKGFEEVNLLSDKLISLKSLGFTTVPYCNYPALDADNNNITMEDMIDHLKETASFKAYPIDGMVFKFDNIEYGKKLGQTSHHFKNAMAYKFYDETYSSILKNIEWTMGRTGVLTPVAVFDTIDIDGSKVSRASLHNLSIMEEIIGIPYKNQQIEVFKANMIIPQIKSANKNDGCNETIIQLPDVCPVCGKPVKIREDNNTKFLVCDNLDCDGQFINKLDHFCGKKGLDIKGLSKATLEKLINWGWVNNIEDIFYLEKYRNEWIQKPGFGVKSVENILNAISVSEQCELNQYIAALGIPLIGTTASKQLAKTFGTWHEFINAVNGNFKFYLLDNFGIEMSRAILSFNYQEACSIAEKFLVIKETVQEEAETSLKDQVFVITGKLTHFKNRDELKSKIESLGGKVTGSVSKNTTYLINNDKESTSSKNKTAKQLGITIINEEDFLKLFE